jgi:hypothetical protein
VLNIILRQQKRRRAAVCLRYHPDFLTAAQHISGKHPEAVFNSVFVGLPVVFVHFVPVATGVAVVEGAQVFVQGSSKCYATPEFHTFKRLSTGASAFAPKVNDSG